MKKAMLSQPMAGKTEEEINTMNNFKEVILKGLIIDGKEVDGLNIQVDGLGEAKDSDITTSFG